MNDKIILSTTATNIRLDTAKCAKFCPISFLPSFSPLLSSDVPSLRVIRTKLLRNNARNTETTPAVAVGSESVS